MLQDINTLVMKEERKRNTPTETEQPILNLDLLTVSDLQQLMRHCKQINDILKQQLAQSSPNGFDILTVP